MKKIYVYKHESSLDHYTADAAVLRCLDNRFWKTFKRFIKHLDFKHIDPQSPAGGILDLASPVQKGDQDYVLRQIGVAVKVHHAKKILLFSHQNCAAYAAIKKFKNPEDEFRFHAKEHKKARGVIKRRFPRLAIESYFIDSEGIVKINF